MTNMYFRWASAKATGSSHLAAGKSCEDALKIDYAYAPDRTPWIIAAVADGAGTAEFGGKAAALACETFVDAMESGITEGLGCDIDALMRSAMTLARFELELAADIMGEPLVKFATTICGYAGTPTSGAFIQIGDGAIVVGACARDASSGVVGAVDQSDWSVALEPKNGEYANVTYFLTCDDWLDHLETKVIAAPVGTVALMSDGIRDLVLKPYTWEPNTKFFGYLHDTLGKHTYPGNAVPFSESLNYYFQRIDVRAKTADDTSLVVLQYMGKDGT